jgi:hypothetical protein
MFWDNYGIIYQGQFDSISLNGGDTVRYKFYISKKFYSGTVTNLVCADNPINITYLDDNPIASIKGSELTLEFINLNNTVNLQSFYSDEDDTFKIHLTITYPNDESQLITNDIYYGFLVQEDCSEIQTDIAHNIQLTFTDGLGLLKNIALNNATKLSAAQSTDIRQKYWWFSTVAKTSTSDAYISIDLFSNLTINIGDSLIVSGSTYYDGIFTVKGIETPAFPIGTRKIFINEIVPISSIGKIQVNITVINYTKLNTILSLATFLRICLQNTSVDRGINYGGGLEVLVPADENRIFENILIQPSTFQNSNNWDSCYDVLDKILTRFGLTLFQSYGRWNLIRFQELRYYSNIIPGHTFDSYFNYLSNANITSVADIGDLTDIEYGLTNTILRPFKYYKETFKYEQPSKWIFNADFSILGELLRTYTVGTDVYKEYFATGWQGAYPPNSGWIFVDRYIRVEFDQYGNEIDRYLVIDKTNTGTSDDRRSVSSEFPLEFNEGDLINVSFQWRTASSHAGNGNEYAVFPGLTQNPGSSANWRFPNQNGTWQNTLGDLGFYFDNNYNQWQTVEVQTKGIPFDSLAYFFLPMISVDNKTYIKNIQIEYDPIISGQKNITGHEHTSYIPQQAKLNEEKDIYIDVSPRSYNTGTLFYEGTTNAIQNKVVSFKDGRTDILYSLGQINTTQQELWRNRQRSKLEGTGLGTLRTGFKFLNPSIVMQYLIKPDTYFIFGKLTISLKQNTFNFTLYEMWQILENDLIFVPGEEDLVPQGIAKDKIVQYTFKYLTK